VYELTAPTVSRMGASLADLAQEVRLSESRLLGGCETGDAKATTAGELPARHVIHTVGPVWQGGAAVEAELLASCHRRSLEVAAELGCRTIAFPAISTGIYGYPVEPAAEIALGTTFAELERHPGIERVTFVLFSNEHLEVYREKLSSSVRPDPPDTSSSITGPTPFA